MLEYGSRPGPQQAPGLQPQVSLKETLQKTDSNLVRGYTSPSHRFSKYFECEILSLMPDHTLKLDRAQKPPLLQNTAIQKKEYSICPQLQVTTLVSCLLLRSVVQKESKKTYFSPKITLPKLNRANACLLLFHSFSSEGSNIAHVLY